MMEGKTSKSLKKGGLKEIKEKEKKYTENGFSPPSDGKKSRTEEKTSKKENNGEQQEH